MKKQRDGWDEVGEDEKVVQYIGCGNAHFHCGKQCRIVGFDKQSESILADGFNPRVRLCIGCCNAIAHKWEIDFEDLDFLMTAIQAAKAGRCGAPLKKADVWPFLERLGVKWRPKYPTSTKELQIPEYDRA